MPLRIQRWRPGCANSGPNPERKLGEVGRSGKAMDALRQAWIGGVVPQHANAAERRGERKSHLGDLNPGPMLYESIALPLS